MIPHAHAPLRWFDDVAQAVVNGPEFIIFAVCATSEECSQLIDWLSAVLPGMTGCAVSVSPGTAIQESVILCPLRQLIHYRDEVSFNLYGGDRKHSTKECHFPVDHLNKLLKEHYQCRAVVFVSSDEQMASFAKEAPNLIEMSAFMRVQPDLPALEPGNPLVPAYQAELKRYEEAYGLSTPEFMRHLYELQDLPEALTESAIRAWQNVANILRNIDRQPQGESPVTKDEKAPPQQQQTEQADSHEKERSGGAGEFFTDSVVNTRKVLQVVDRLVVFSRKWPRVQRALLAAVENLEFSIEMTKKSAELVSEFVSGSDTEQAAKEIAAVQVHTNDRWRARYTVSDEVVRSHPTWLMRCFNGGGKHLVISSDEMMHLDPDTRVRPLGESWRNLAPVHNEKPEWRFLSDVNYGTFLWDQRWQTRMNPEQECHISADGEFIGRNSWNPKIQIRPIGATWEQVEENERCRSKAKKPGVN